MKDDSVREKAIDKLVAARLRAGLKAGGTACPDAETLGAFVERTLAPRERTSCENHLATCARCQGSVAELVRLSEADGTSVVHAPVSSRGTRPFVFRWAWAGTALAAVLVAGIWITDEYQTGLHQREASKAPPTTLARKQPTAPPIPLGEEKPSGGEKKGAAVGPTLGPASGPGQATALRGRSAKEADAEAVRARNPSPTPEVTAQTAPSPAPTMARAETGRQTLGATPAASADMAKSQSALAGATGGAIAKAENAPSAPPPPTATLAVQRVREATHLETEARAEQFKAARLTPAAKTAAHGLFGTVSGTVKDATGAAVPSAKVTVRDASTNAATVLTTNNAGAYVAPSLNPGVYKLEADANGFKTSVVNDVTLEAEATRKVDFVLEVGAATQTVQVQAQASPVQTQQSSLDQTVKQRSINELSIQGRNYRSHLTLQTAQPAWRVGPRGLILEADSHGNWKKRPSGVKRDLFNVSFSSSSVGWVVGERGTILRTTDGGNTWLKMPSPTDADLMQVTATNELTAAVATRSGVTYTTTDGGKTWSGASR